MTAEEEARTKHSAETDDSDHENAMSKTNAPEDYGWEETPEEAQRNRGTITVFEQIEETEDHEEGDRYVTLGYDTNRHILDEENEDFLLVAKPLAHIELLEPIERDAMTEWCNSDVGKIVLSEFFDDLEGADVLTPWGEQQMEGDQ